MNKLRMAIFCIALAFTAEAMADHLLYPATGTDDSLTTGATFIHDEEPLGPHTEALRIVADEASFIMLGVSSGIGDNQEGIASNTTGFFIPADTEIIIGVHGGEYISARASDTGGMIYLHELTR
jgi:hypothetical protein|tara:strand:+ start:3265 stop:3636 length:372 start_codon:yes stop_codon:yes gene_type:complete